MKKVKTIISIAFSFVLMLSLPITVFALDFDEHQVKLEYSNAPEGTAYIDILIKMDENDENYVQFTSTPPYSKDVPIQIDENSEIAQLNDDGYVSLSLHYKDAHLSMSTNEYALLYISECSFTKLHDTYKDFKAAYVDEKGSVLGITELSQTESSADKPYGFYADGNALIYREWSSHGSGLAAVLTVLAATLGIVVILIILLIVLVKRRKRRELRDLTKQE